MTHVAVQLEIGHDVVGFGAARKMALEDAVLARLCVTRATRVARHSATWRAGKRRRAAKRRRTAKRRAAKAVRWLLIPAGKVGHARIRREHWTTVVVVVVVAKVVAAAKRAAVAVVGVPARMSLLEVNAELGLSVVGTIARRIGIATPETVGTGIGGLNRLKIGTDRKSVV